VTESSLTGYINRKLTYLFIALIIIVVISVFFIIEGFIENIVYTYMYDVTIDSVFSSLDQYAENINIQEKSYDRLLSDLTSDFNKALKSQDTPIQQLSDSNYSGSLGEVLASYSSGMELIGLPKGISDQIFFYIVDNTGTIIKSNDEEQLGEKLHNFSKVDQSLNGEILLQRYINEVDSYGSRKYGYVRYSDQYLIKLSLPLHITFYDKITERFTSMQEKFVFLKEIALYRGAYTPVNDVFGYPTEEDRQYFSQLTEENPSIRQAINNYSFIYYTTWNHGMDNVNYISSLPYYIRFKMDFSDNILLISRTITLFICIILSLAIFSVYFINRRLSQKITTPFVDLAENMTRLGTHADLSNIDEKLERTDIKEVNMLLASYQEMTSELSSSFEELRAVNDELEDSYRETSVLAENLHNVIQMATKLTDTVFDDKERFLIELFYVAKKLIPEADYGTVFVVDNDKLKCLESVGHSMQDIKSIAFKDDMYNSLDEVIYIKDVDKEKENLSDSQLRLLNSKRPIRSSLMVKLYVGDELAGALNYDIAENNKASFSKQSIETIKAFGNLASAFLTMQSYKHIHERFQRQIILAIISMLEIHDSYTKGHSENVGRISAMIAKEMGYSAADVKNIEWAGLVHDIGKILISKKILNKEGVLTADEYTQIKKHTIWGYEVLVSSDELKDIAVYMRHHHERWDGMGYPDQLKGKEIPRVSRIIGLADSWDTMRSDRIYRKKLSLEIAIEELEANKGTQFDPEVVDVAMRLIEEGKLD